MKWNEVRLQYPDQWVKLQILNSHEEDNYLYIDEMDIIQTIPSDKDATKELVKCTAQNIMLNEFTVNDADFYLGTIDDNINGLLGLDVLIKSNAIINLNNMSIQIESL